MWLSSCATRSGYSIAALLWFLGLIISAELVRADQPTDPQYASQWYYSLLNAPQAWDTTTGSPQVVVAIIDTGVDSSHPDLAANIVPGWNIYSNNSDTSDVNGRGTMIAGIIAAVRNNGIGIAGMAPNARIMPIRVSTTDGTLLVTKIAEALIWAADHGAKIAVIGASVGGIAGDNPAVISAAQYFYDRGGLVFAPSGNTRLYRLAFDNPYIITVGVSNKLDRVPQTFTFSQGSDVDLSMPGEDIPSTQQGGGYGTGTGTSFSTPIAAGIAALVFSVNPSLTPEQVTQILKAATFDNGVPGWCSPLGWGRIDAANAVSFALQGPLVDVTPPAVQITSPAEGAIVSGSQPIEVTVNDPSGIFSVSLFDNKRWLGNDITSPHTLTYPTQAVPNESERELIVIAWDKKGNEIRKPLHVRVRNNDSNPPSLVITSHTNGSVLSGAVIVTATAQDDVAVRTIKLFLDGSPLADESSTDTGLGLDIFNYNNEEWDINPTVDVRAKAFSYKFRNNAPHLLTGMVSDFAGNTATIEPISVTTSNPADTQVPTTVIHYPVSGEVYPLIENVRTQHSDNTGVRLIEYLMDGQLFFSLDYLSQYMPKAVGYTDWGHELVAGGWPNGPHTLLVRTHDNWGNTSERSVSFNYGAGDVGPTATIISPAEGSVVSGAITIGIDAPPTAQAAYVAINSAHFSLLTRPFELPFNTTSLADGSYTITARAASVTTMGPPQSIQIQVNNSTAPKISESIPPNGYIDPREDRNASNPDLLFGIQDVYITFSEPVSSGDGELLTLLNFERRYIRGNIAGATDLQTETFPSVSLISGSGTGPYHLQFLPRIPLGAWTEIKAVNVIATSGGMEISPTENRVILGALPMDIDQDGQVLGGDIEHWRNVFNDPLNTNKLNLLDQKRNGVISGEDMQRAQQLLHGQNTSYQNWNGFNLGPKP